MAKTNNTKKQSVVATDIKPELKSYNDSIKEGLQHGEEFTKLMDNLITTNAFRTLLTSAKKLANYTLNTSLVTFPYQYSKSDFCLIFMTRLMKKIDEPDLPMIQKSTSSLIHSYKSLGTLDSFYFEPAKKGAKDGVYYSDTKYNEHIFYLDLKGKILSFNSLSVTKLFISDYDGANRAKAQKFVHTLIDFGRCLQKHYRFHVNFSIFGVKNKFYPFMSLNNRQKILDNLFIMAAQDGYSLKSYHFIGAQLQLDNNVHVNIYPNKDGHWGLEVEDPKNNVSWLDVIMKYSFVKTWYLRNLQQLLLK